MSDNNKASAWIEVIPFLVGLALLAATIYIAFTSDIPSNGEARTTTTCPSDDWVCHNPHEAAILQYSSD